LAFLASTGTRKLIVRVLIYASTLFSQNLVDSRTPLLRGAWWYIVLYTLPPSISFNMHATLVLCLSVLAISTSVQGFVPVRRLRPHNDLLLHRNRTKRRDGICNMDNTWLPELTHTDVTYDLWALWGYFYTPLVSSSAREQPPN